MKVLIIEDERFSAERLKQQLSSIDKDIIVLDILDSVEKSIDWFQNNEAELVFLDIHLADTNSFEIFKKVEIKTPIIFTTAYNQYAIQAFKLNSIDYLLKPIDIEELEIAVNKFKEIYQVASPPTVETNVLENLLQKKESFKKRFLVKKGAQFKSILSQDIVYFVSEKKLTYLINLEGEKYIIDQSLDELSQVLDPQQFFRINRQMILSIDAIQKIHTFFNGRLKLEIIHQSEDEVFVSRDRVQAFKDWLD
ncbi:MAG: response regulator transcription factor [Cytophagales bacterium]|nr:response regulator transcription factor [Cytophagales bacterium]